MYLSTNISSALKFSKNSSNIFKLVLSKQQRILKMHETYRNFTLLRSAVLNDLTFFQKGK